MSEATQSKEKLYKRIGTAFILFGLLGLIDTVASVLLKTGDTGIIGYVLVAVIGIAGAYIVTLARIWPIWLAVGYWFDTKAKIEAEVAAGTFDPNGKLAKRLRRLKWLMIVLGVAIALIVIFTFYLAFNQ